MSENYECIISTDKSLLDIQMIITFLGNSYWAKGRPASIIERSIENSLCFGVYLNDKQIGFARVITDYAVFGYLADVFILEEYRGNGYSKKLIQRIIDHPDLKYIKRWILATKDAHGLYAKTGFRPLENPQRFMELIRHDSYDDLEFHSN